MRKLILAFLCLISFCTFCMAQINSVDSSEVYTIVEEMPIFIGGDEALFKFLSANVSYPEEAKTNGISGTVYLHFVITKNAVVSDVKVIRGVQAMLDTEAVRVIKSSNGNWIAGKQNGQLVNVEMNLPIKFVLADGSGDLKQLFTDAKSNSQPARIDTYSRDTYFNEGVKLVGENKLNKALNSFKRASQYDPKDAGILFNIGAVYLQMNDTKKACNYFNRVKKLNSTRSDELYKQYCKDE